MAKSMTVGKRENEKKRIAKREEKLKKKENKKLSGSSNSFEDMIAYVDENGRITSTPPTENVRKEEINPDEIVIATPKKEDEEPTILRGRVEFFNESRGFGFIKDLSGVEKYFFHVNNVVGNITENNIVTFDLERPNYRKNTASKENRGNTTSSMGQRAGSKVGAVLDTKNKVKDKANAVKENIKDMPTQTAYAVYSAKEKAKSSVSDFKRGMVQEQQSRQTGRLEKQTQHRQNIADKRMELQKAQEARQAQRKADGSATTGATRPHERPATASTIPKPSMEKTQEVKRPATATTSKTSEPVKTSVIKERPLSSGASDRKATQSVQPVHRQNVEKVVSQETRQNYKAERTTKTQTFEQSKRTTEHTEKNRSLVMKKGQKKK